MKLTTLGQEQIAKSQRGSIDSLLTGHPGVRVVAIHGREVWLEACLFDKRGQALAILDHKKCVLDDVIRLGQELVIPVKIRSEGNLLR